MNRENAVKTLIEMGEIIARERGLCHAESRDFDCGFWDMGSVKTSDILEKQYGEMGTVLFHGDEKFRDRWKDTVEVGYRFANPRLVVRGSREDNLEWLASIEVSAWTYDGDEPFRGDDYKFGESQVWRDEGVEMFLRLRAMWTERGGE